MGLALVLSFFLLSFYGLFRTLKIPANLVPLVLFSLISTLLFLGALLGQLKITSYGLIAGLSALGTASLLNDIKKRIFDRQAMTLFLIYLASAIGVFFYTHPMNLAVIDEHVYWAIMGKSLWLHDQLPLSDTPIIAGHLRYTPGMSLIHYLFFQLFGEYREAIAYFAQSSALIACLFVIVQYQYLKQTLCIAFLLLILLHVQYGSVLARLDVDYLISALVLALSYITQRSDSKLTLFPRVLLFSYLSLIKEIGLYFAITFLILDAILNPQQLKEDLIVLFAILVNHVLWTHYCDTQGFPHFMSHRTAFDILQDFNPFNSVSRKAQWVFIDDLFLGPIDRMKTPGILWFIGIGIIYRKLPGWSFSSHLSPITPIQAQKVLGGLSLIFITYLVLLYELQVSTFNLGQSALQIVAQRRYLNLGFSQIGLWAILMALTHYFGSSVRKRSYHRILALSLSFIAYSYYHRLPVDPEYQMGKDISIALHQEPWTIPKGSHVSVITVPHDEALAKRYALQLKHYLLDLDLTTSATDMGTPYILSITEDQWSIITHSPQNSL